MTVQELLDKEEEKGYSETAPYEGFAHGVKKSADNLKNFLYDNMDKVVYGYGASTKGQIIMQYCKIGPDQVRSIAERNPRKYGLQTPGTNVPICPESEMRDAKPDYLVIFPWYFLEEFKDREKALRETGTKLVVPLPSFSVI